MRPSAVALAAALAAAPAFAADPPKFEFGKQEEVKEVVWRASANLGVIWTTGNSSTITVSGGAQASRNDGKNKLSLEAAGTFARAVVKEAHDNKTVNGTIEPDEITEVAKVTAATWLTRFRYDRFFTENNAGYVAAFASGDVPAGKELVAGGQAGYARHFYQTKTQDVVGELGYDFSFVDYAADTVPDTVAIHSLRAFAGWLNAVTDNTQFAISLEALFNLNPIDTPTGRAGPFEDVRLLGKASLTTKLWRALAFRFSFTAKFDNQPAPLPPLPPDKLPYAAGFKPAADKLDTITEAAVIFNFI